jgi:hypothetical protein
MSRIKIDMEANAVLFYKTLHFIVFAIREEEWIEVDKDVLPLIKRINELADEGLPEFAKRPFLIDG